MGKPKKRKSGSKKKSGSRKKSRSKSKSKSKSNDGRWIQKAIKNPGALREYVKRNYGKEGFTKDGDIKVSVLRQLARGIGPSGRSVSETTRRRAQLALNLRGMRR